MSKPKNASPTKSPATTTPTVQPPSSAFETVTPAIAAEYLAHNDNNRSLMQRRVDEYAATMSNDGWRLSHQGIAFGRDGTLYDGQHRLHAVVKAGVPIVMMVTRNLPPEAREEIDRGRNRSAADNLAIVEGIRITKTMASALNIAWKASVAKSLARNATTAELRDTLMAHLAGYEAMVKVFANDKRGVTRGAFVAAFIFAYPTAPERVYVAAQRFYTGAELAADNPMFVLREYALNHPATDVGSAVDDFRRALGMIAAELDGEKRLRVMVKSSASIDDSRAYNRFAKVHDKAK